MPAQATCSHRRESAQVGGIERFIGNLEVRLGSEDWDDRLGRLGGVLAQLRASGQRATSIDLRFRDQIVLRTAAK